MRIKQLTAIPLIGVSLITLFVLGCSKNNNKNTSKKTTPQTENNAAIETNVTNNINVTPAAPTVENTTSTENTAKTSANTNSETTATPETPPETTDAAETATSTTMNAGRYTLADVAQHSTKTDCWLAIHDQVYDVTTFIAEHPGGDAILQGCGRDATTLFETRPMGSGKPHSDQARDLMKNYYIGDLK